MKKEAVIRNYGVSTETYFMIDAHRISRKGLNTVYLDYERRGKWDGNKEVELTLCGTGVTWLLWLVWLCVSVYLFFYSSVQSMALGLLVLLGSGLCYYLFFIRSARKIIEKAMNIFYKVIFCNGFY